MWGDQAWGEESWDYVYIASSPPSSFVSAWAMRANVVLGVRVA